MIELKKTHLENNKKNVALSKFEFIKPDNLVRKIPFITVCDTVLKNIFLCVLCYFSYHVLGEHASGPLVQLRAFGARIHISKTNLLPPPPPKKANKKNK